MKNLSFFRYFAYALLIVVFSILQGTPNLLPEICGGKPLLLMCLAISIASVEEKIPSLIFGAVCGVLIDISSGGTIGFFAIILTLLCYFESNIFSTYLISGFLQVMVFALLSIPLIIGIYFLLFTVFAGIPDSGILFVNHYISRIVYTFVMTVPVYFVTRFIHNST